MSVIKVTQRACGVSILRDTKTPLNTALSRAGAHHEQGLDWVTSRGVLQSQSFGDSVNSTQHVNHGQNKCSYLFCEGWKQQAKASDLNEDTSTFSRDQPGWVFCVLSLTLQSLHWGILEMASSTNLGDEARKDNAGAHITLPEVWGSGALFCSYKPQPSCTLAHTCVYRLPGTQSRAPL